MMTSTPPRRSNPIAAAGKHRQKAGDITSHEAQSSSSSSLIVPHQNQLVTSTTLERLLKTNGLSINENVNNDSNPETKKEIAAPPSSSRHDTARPQLDFVGSSASVKQICASQLTNQPICVAIHNINGTLLIDDADVVSTGALFSESNPTPPSERNDHGSQGSSWMPPSTLKNDCSSTSHANTLSMMMRSNRTQEEEHALSSLLSNNLKLSPTSSPSSSASSQQKNSRLLLPLLSSSSGDPNKSPIVEEETKSTTTLTKYVPNPAREYIPWTLNELQLLIGSDAVILRPPSSSPSTSQHPHDENSSSVIVRVEDVQKLQQAHRLHQEQQPILPSEKANPMINDSDTPNSQKTGGGEIRSYRQALIESNNNSGTAPGECAAASVSSSVSKCIVLDAYLDNVLANVPQLALVLQEKGLVQDIKLLSTEQVPSRMMHPSTIFKTEAPKQKVDDVEDEMFSPEIMEMNATALLRFLKANCTKDNSTYLLRTTTSPDGSTAAGENHNNIQLYDISSISQPRQEKWIWWLATMSFRFAMRLRQLENGGCSASSGTGDAMFQLPLHQQRLFRDRQRSLLQTSLDLLQELQDRNGNAHESLVASVREHMADTYLNDKDSNQNSSAMSSDEQQQRHVSPKRRPDSLSSAIEPPRSRSNNIKVESLTVPQPPTLSPASSSSSQGCSTDRDAPPIVSLRPTTSSPPPASSLKEDRSSYTMRPYAKVTADALNKAHDHLLAGIKALWPVFEHSLTPPQTRSKGTPSSSARRKRGRQSHGLSQEESTEVDERSIPPPAMTLQLLGLHSKVIDISLQLTEHHLQNYFSSSAMQVLRNTARRMVDADSLLNHISSDDQRKKYTQSLQQQCSWLWEHCGFFARSFASDELWRDRGHASGEDVVSVLVNVQSAFVLAYTESSRGGFDASEFLTFAATSSAMSKETNDRVCFESLSGIVTAGSKAERAKIELLATSHLSLQKQIQREKRQVLVAACIAYSQAIQSLDNLLTSSPRRQVDMSNVLNTFRQRLGDACNETGNELVTALRTLLSSSLSENHREKVAMALLESAIFWFNKALDVFSSCSDLRNIALVRCNLCQCEKLRANGTFFKITSSSDKNEAHVEACLTAAAQHLEAAHESMGIREADPRTWDMVSNELAATFLVLAVRRRQSLLGGGTTPVCSPSLRLSPGKERSILEPMERALKVYEQAGNQQQAAATHYQLALTNSKVWTCQRDESKTREKLSAAFLHYNHAFAYFSQAIQDNEPTFVLICLDAASLYSAVSGEECLVKALGRCMDAQAAFSRKVIEESIVRINREEWLSKMVTLADSLEDRVFKLLKSLVMLQADKYKDAYRAALTNKASPAQHSSALVSENRLENLHHMISTLRPFFANA